jgi:hypothetical protein
MAGVNMVTGKNVSKDRFSFFGMFFDVVEKIFRSNEIRVHSLILFDRRATGNHESESAFF